MRKLYEEDAVFDRFSAFDTDTGRLEAIDGAAFREAPVHAQNAETEPGIVRREGPGICTFAGSTSHTHTRFPRRIYFQITRNCNLQCEYCYLNCRAGQPHVPTDQVLEMARYLGTNGLMEVRLTGGEPTTHPDFLRILDAFRESGVYVSVATNGILSPMTIDGLARRKHLWVICSVDGARQTHNRFRPGTFDRILANLRELKERNPAIRLRLTTVLCRTNRHDIPELGKLVRSLDAESITFIPLRPQVRSPEVLEQMLDAREFGEAVREIAEMGETLGIKVTTTIETKHAGKIWADPVVRKRFACAAGREATNLDYDARRGVFLLYGCSYSPAPDPDAPPEIRRPFLAGEFAPGNVSRFFDIWSDDTRWKIYRDSSLKPDECRECEYFQNHTCVGSCPIQNVELSRIDTGEDVLAQLQDQIRHTSEWYCYRRVYDAESN